MPWSKLFFGLTLFLGALHLYKRSAFLEQDLVSACAGGRRVGEPVSRPCSKKHFSFGVVILSLRVSLEESENSMSACRRFVVMVHVEKK